jgi:hypothetical protein
MKTIKGKIIRIVDKSTVIINLGKEHGVKHYTIFSIMGEPEQIIDPDTNEVLGEVTIVKSRVKAKEVAEQFSIATTKWIATNFNIFSAFISSIEKNVERTEVDEGELHVDESEIKPWKAKSESPVKVGDIVHFDVEEAVDKENKLIDKIEGADSEGINKDNGDLKSKCT